MARAKGVIVTTFKPDQYDRHLADIFLEMDSEEGGRTQQDCASTGEILLNNDLLANGHAVRKNRWEFRDWDKVLGG